MVGAADFSIIGCPVLRSLVATYEQILIIIKH